MICRSRGPRRSTAASATLVLFATSLALWPLPTHAQDADRPPVVVQPGAGPAPGIDPAPDDLVSTSRQAGDGITPIIAPIPFKDTQIGWGLLLFVGAIHRFDADTTRKPSTGGIGGFYTENDSWGVVAGEVARFAGDAWRARGSVGYMVLNYDFYGIGQDAGDANRSIHLQQDLTMAFGALLRRLYPGLYLGVNGVWLGTEVRLKNPPDLGFPVPDSKTVNLVGPGIALEFDTRDDDYWPVQGSLARARANFFTDALGSARNFERYTAMWSWYTRMPAERLVLATNIFLAASGGDAPFYMLPSIGMGATGLRGYTSGRYRDRVMSTLQGELRYRLKNRFGGTVFGGFGQVAPDGAGLFDAAVLWAGGLGLRYQLTQDYPMNLRFDYAWGEDEQLFYFALTEAF